MKKIGIVFGTTSGTTERIAQQIAQMLGVSSTDIWDAGKIKPENIMPYEVLILGSSTWGDGELQDDWYDGVKTLKKCDLTGKKIALFGCGDSESYSDTFGDAVGLLYNELKESGCLFVGNNVDPQEYTFSSSIAMIDGVFVGLPLDEMNESHKTADRLRHWLQVLQKQLL